MFARFFIDRPIFATVLSIMTTLAGAVAWWTLPVAQYPEIAPPTVEVSAIYPGANALTVADTVAAPIEQQVNGVEGMLYMSSRATNDGGYALTVAFKPGVDLNVAQVLVQNRVNLASPVLPELVRRRGVTVKKKSPTTLMMVNLFSPDESRDNLYLSNYATLHIRDEMSRVSGVGDVSFLGQRDYSMRLWLDPEKMAVRNLAASDVVRAIEQQNIQVAAGQVGQPPAPDGQIFQYTINALGRLSDPEQFSDIILKSDINGKITRIRDVSRVELGAIGYDQLCTLDGKPSVALSVFQLPGSNALATARNVRLKMEELRDKFPEGVDYSIVYDTTPFIDESVREVFITLMHAVALVAAVMLLFLQSWRAAIIPLAAVPVAIIGTFTVMAAMQYSLNNLTLFGLVLAVGIVVDDAIVVVEAVQHHIEHGLSPRDAAIKAMDEVAAPVIAVGLVLAAVFVPCIFIAGIIGQFFRQFAITIAISTLISVFNSLTLSPALCALLLRREEGVTLQPLPLPRVTYGVGFATLAYFWGSWAVLAFISFLPDAIRAPIANWLTAGDRSLLLAILCGIVGAATGPWLNHGMGLFFGAFNTAFQWATRGYLAGVNAALWVTPLVLIGYCGLLYLTGKVLNEAPVGFVPEQDKGYLLLNVQLPDSASLARTDSVMQAIDNIARDTEGVRHTVAVRGQSALIGAAAPNFGMVYVMLEPHEHRKSHEQHAFEIARRLQAELNDGVPEALVNVFGAPAVDGLGAAGGFVLVIEDRANLGLNALQEASNDLVSAAKDEAEVRDAFVGFRADTPWLRLDIDRVAAKTKGVAVSEIMNTLQVYFGSLYINDFNWRGRTWQVNVQADSRFRQTEDDLKKLRVRNESREMVPLAAFLTIKEDTGPVMVQRYNLYPAATVTITPAPMTSSGQVIAASEEKAKTALPESMNYEWTELALLQLQTKDTAQWAFALAVILAFLVLAAQYESWTLPLAIVMVVPLCLLCAAVGVRSVGQDINIFTQIGFVVLAGLACKNAILIVEFAKQERDSGVNRWEATIAACRLRLRPIVMTSVAFILGVVPLVIAEGAGAEMRRPLGTAVFAGMIGVTLFGLVLTPVCFFAIQWLADLFSSSMARETSEVDDDNEDESNEEAGDVEHERVLH